MLAFDDPAVFADAVLTDTPPQPLDQDRIVAANRAGRVPAPA
jgi:hypothetical protein